MKKFIITGALCAFLVAGGVNVASAATTTAATDQSSMKAQIEQLLKLIADLKAQLNDAVGQVMELQMDVAEGAEGDDVLKVQEVLATDPALFGVKPTGFFGPMTREALKKFQERYGLEVTGKLDEPTREAIKELREDGKVIPGLLQSGEVKDRIRARLQEKWGDCDFTLPFRASLCEKAKEGNSDEDDEGEEEDEDDEEVTRDDARRAVVDAQNEINKFRNEIEAMEDDDADDEDIDEAKELLAEAKIKMADARRAFYKMDFDAAFEAAEDVLD